MLTADPSLPADNGADFAKLAWTHSEALYRLAHKWVGNRDDAWDLVQETFERVLRSDHSRIPAERMGGWLFVVAKNLFRDHYRRCKRRRLKGPKEAAVIATLYEPKASDEGGDGQWSSVGSDDVQRAVAFLSPALATVWRLHVVEGLSYAEVSARLNTPAATVGTRLLRARRQLRRILVTLPPREIAATRSMVMAPVAAPKGRTTNVMAVASRAPSAERFAAAA